MSQRPVRRAFVAAAVLLALASPMSALAQSDGIPIAVVPVPNAPVAITSCRKNAWLYTVVNNRTTHGLLSIAVDIRYFDQDNTLVGEAKPSNAISPPVDGGENTIVQLDPSAGFSEPASAIVRATCRIQSATFTSNKKWTYGQRWTDKLLPPRHASANDVGQEPQSGLAPSRSAPAPTQRPRVHIAITSAWTDNVNGVLYVHDALAITGGDTPATLQPSDVVLTLTLANGASKTYAAMDQPAPTYAKLNPLGDTPTIAYEVDPAADFGRIGPMTIPPHATVTTTATFMVPDLVSANATYRDVAVQ